MEYFILLLILIYFSLIHANGREMIMLKKRIIENQKQTKYQRECFCSILDGFIEQKCPTETLDNCIKFYDNISSATEKYEKNTNENDQLSLKSFMKSSKIYKFGLYALIVAMVGDILISFLLSLFYNGYSNMKMSISALGNPKSPIKMAFNLWMLMEGILFLLSLPALYKYYYPISSRFTILMIIFISLFSICSCVFTCFFSVNESKDDITLASKIHEASSSLGFTLFLFVPLLAAILSFKNKEIIIGIVSIICFTTGLFFFVLFVMSQKEIFSNTFINNEGLWQRLNLLFMYLPLVIIAIKRINEKQGM